MDKVLAVVLSIFISSMAFTGPPSNVKVNDDPPVTVQTVDPVNTDDSVVTAVTPEEAAPLGTWVATKQNGRDMELGDIRYRLTSITDDQDLIMTAIEQYNADDNNFRKIDPALPEAYSFRLVEYEVVYEEGYAGYGDENNRIYSPAPYFSITSQSGGGLRSSDGLSHLGLTTMDISEDVEEFYVGDTFQGQMVYAIPDKVSEQYFLRLNYSDNDSEGNAMSVYSYALPEVIELVE